MRASILLAAAVALLPAAAARGDLFKLDSFSAFGDFRFRAESDWGSQNAAGEERDDRNRLRVRMRAGFAFEPNENLRAELRLRSGQEASQQSPHITILDFDDNDTGDASFNFDRWYLKGKVGGFEIWAGRNNLPIWRQDEMLFDDDVTLAGVGLKYGTEVGPGKLSLGGGYFTPPVGMTDFSGNLAAGQVAYQPEVGGVKLAFAGGVYLFDANPDDPDSALLLQGNGARDYSIVAGSLQARWQIQERPLVLGADLMANTEDYDPDDPDPDTAANADETDGYVLLATYGGLGRANDWLVGYYYAHIETLAVNNSYAQDDWVRWGSATQTRASNMKGHELRLGWAFSANMNLLARLYLVDSITTVEDGNRFRLDFNYKF